jgi:hypothetical protein
MFYTCLRLRSAFHFIRGVPRVVQVHRSAAELFSECQEAALLSLEAQTLLVVQPTHGAAVFRRRAYEASRTHHPHCGSQVLSAHTPSDLVRIQSAYHTDQKRSRSYSPSTRRTRQIGVHLVLHGILSRRIY